MARSQWDEWIWRKSKTVAFDRPFICQQKTYGAQHITNHEHIAFIALSFTFACFVYISHKCWGKNH